MGLGDRLGRIFRDVVRLDQAAAGSIVLLFLVRMHRGIKGRDIGA